MEFNNYIKQFQKLHVSRSSGVAPHKPVLLISVLDEIETGRITENKIFITPELVATFKENWSSLVDSKIFEPRFALPFYHLKSESFWQLITLPGCEIAVTSSNSIRSFAALKSAIDFAKFNDDLFLFLLDKNNRAVLRTTLLDTFFPLTKRKYINTKGSHGKYIANIESKLLNESPSEYKLEIAKADEEEIFLRGGVFKRVVPLVYNYTCCISGMRIAATSNIQMIDACHIVPFSESHDDTITNGISLCPNLHRAFDRGLISINEEYKVIVSNSFVESDTNYSLKMFEGKKIHLPKEEKNFPSIEGLRLHTSNRFQK